MPQQSRNVWTLQDAKNQFSEVVRNALEHGPQTVTRHGESAVVIVSTQEFDRLRGKGESLYDVIRNSPLYGVELDIERDRSEPREVDLPDFDLPE